MGRLDLSAQRVHQHASRLIEAKRLGTPPPWYDVVGTIPPAARLVRPAMQRSQRAGKKSSKMFTPIKISYEEDRLRWEYFNDHPWELAKPRVILEEDGKDYQRWDWSHALCRPEEKDVWPKHVKDRSQAKRIAEEAIDAWVAKQKTQANRPLNGESVVQRQYWLMKNGGLTEAAAYDKARKELYRSRHAHEVEVRVAKEEAMAYGAYFGKGPLEVGMLLEDKMYADWHKWAVAENLASRAKAASAYTGNEAEESNPTELRDPEAEELQEVADLVPGSQAGLTAEGGAAIHP